MTDKDAGEKPVPGLAGGPDAEPGPLLYTLAVDGEMFAAVAAAALTMAG